MSTTLPVTFRASPLPSNFRGTPQQFLDALVARLSIQNQEELSLFVSGSIAPTSNVGPWLKDGITWYVWDNGTGAYIPEIIEFRSLRYVVANSAPDHALYTLWIQTDGAGKAQSIKTYYSGAWVDIYADALANLQTGINKAYNTYPSAAKLTGTQTVDVDTDVHQVNFNQVIIDPDGAYDAMSSSYIAPANGVYRVNANLQIDNGTADAAMMEIAINVFVNGAPGIFGPSSGASTPSPNGLRWYPQVGGLIQMAIGDAASIWISGNDGTNTGNMTVAASSQFYIELVRAA